MKKTTVIVMTVLLLFSCIMPVSTIKISPSLKCVVLQTEDIPAETAYIDLLLPIAEIPECYTEWNQTYSADGIASENIHISTDSAIANYNEDGYCSFLAHFEHAKITVSPSDDNGLWVTFGDDNYENLYYFQKCKSIKLAFVDKDGNILKVTEAVSVRDRIFSSFQNIELHGDTVKCVYSFNPYRSVPIAVLVALAGIYGILKWHDARRAKRFGQ